MHDVRLCAVGSCVVARSCDVWGAALVVVPLLSVSRVLGAYARHV